jgi:hypothetical protein
MAFMAAALPYISAGMAVATTMADANTKERLAEIEADQLEKQAIADTAMSVQQAKGERKRAEELKSRALALAAKSGHSGSDIDKVVSDIDQQGEYNALAALYSGSTASASKKYAAAASRAYGSSAKASGYADAGGTILGAMDTYYG